MASIKYVKLLYAVGLVIIFMVISIPIFMYWLYFGENRISTHPDDWADFGSYVGGSIGSILSLLAVIFSCIGVYLTWSIARSVEKAEILRNRPAPYLDLGNYPTGIRIALQNFGGGPMKVTSIAIIQDQSIKHLHFRELFERHEIPRFDSDFPGDRFINSAPTHVLIPGGSKDLLRFTSEHESAEWTDILGTIRSVISSCSIEIHYEDTFQLMYTYKEKLDFLRYQY